MAADWRALFNGLNVKVEGDEVVINFDNGRSQRVRVCETDEVLELHAIVARASAVRDVRDLPLRLWLHNRAAQLVSFRIDTRGRVYAEGWVPKVGMTAEELQLVLRRVAAESDRLEFLLTGKDAE
jgi:hypothetical protein